MKKILQALKRFFFPKPGAPVWLIVLPYLVLGVLTLLVLVGGAYAWDYTNSPVFCGTACHTMPPEYTSYLTSPHARVDCVECHIGRDFIATRISRKAGDARHIFATLFVTYEFPIHAHNMRPARDTCERCHFPEKFADDSLRELKLFESDQFNSPTSLYLVMKTGGGSERMGLGRGIHWHIENQVLYYPLDLLEQEIPYVKVVNRDGSTNEYIDFESNFDPSTIDPADLKEMDCITCHNRITHIIQTPEATIDQLLDRGLVSPRIPDIRRIAVDVYSRIYDTAEVGLNGIAGIAGYYQVYYPEFYADNTELVASAITALQDAYAQSVFPEQKADWNSHPNNIGHSDSAGCFRCHGGTHLDSQQQAIRLECNLCHSIPVVAQVGDLTATIEISRGPEPQSHLNPNWISLHHLAYDATCSNCHTTANPGGTDNQSFCSNSACHGSVWEYAGFDAPALREVLISQLPPTPTPLPAFTPGELTYTGGINGLFELRCGSCHGPAGAIASLDLTTYDAILAGGASGPSIVPSDPEASLLIQKQTGPQPHFGQFTSEELEAVTDWIAAGAPQE
jgi:nitrate/TMAO reductase-like tetraheme cytochrome c subunit